MVAASAAELPTPEPEAPPAAFVARHPLSFGIGATSLHSFSPAGTRAGPALDLRHESQLAPRLQLGVTFTLGLTTFSNTVALGEWAIDHGAWTTRAFGSVNDWVARPVDPALQPFKIMGAFFAYFGLVVSYAIVPVVFVVSPFAAIGHVSLAPTVSFHSSERSPNVYAEAGVGFLLYGHPAGEGPQAGLGPVVGVGTQLGHHTLGLRVLISPPGLNDGGGDTLIEPALVFGF